MRQRIYLITAIQVKRINEEVCCNSSSEHRCYDLGKIESALHSAFYPGSYPFYHGGVAKVAGALAYYILKAHAFFDGNKRTALLVSTAFMTLNGWELCYPMSDDKYPL